MLLLGVMPAAARAACTPAQRADARAITQMVASMRATGHGGASDAAALAERARRSCADLRPARAIIQATQRTATPRINQRRRVLDVDLIGTRDTGRIVWRLDLVRLAVRIKGERRTRVLRVLDQRLAAASFGVGTTIWSSDPTRVRFDADRQSAVASTLSASPRRSDRQRAGRGVRAFATRLSLPARAGLLQQLRIANRLALAAQRSGSAAARDAARRVALRALVRMRAASVQGWSKIGGTWATARQHRTLATQGGLLVRRVPHAASRRVADHLRATLRNPADIDFGTLPDAAFYPWPRDGAFDTQQLTLSIDKPARVRLSIFAADGDGVIHVLQQDVTPGTITFTWDGSTTSGDIAAAGQYRYRIDASDLFGNAVRIPGLRHFTVARDTIKPSITAASARYVRTSTARRIIASWDVTEEHSPQVRSWLLLRKGEARASIKLHDRVQRATVRRNVQLEAGTWTGTMVFIDGSGNRASRAIGEVVVR